MIWTIKYCSMTECCNRAKGPGDLGGNVRLRSSSWLTLLGVLSPLRTGAAPWPGHPGPGWDRPWCAVGAVPWGSQENFLWDGADGTFHSGHHLTAPLHRGALTARK